MNELCQDKLHQDKSRFIKRLKKNVLGRDYFVGDLHGCFWLLEMGMQLVDFDREKDRIICVGDLVDRGPESDRVLEFLNQPWFHAVQGNHEDCAVWCAFGGRQEKIHLPSYVEHGGGWFVALTQGERCEYADQFAHLPILIEVETELGLIGVVHADTFNDNWDFTVEKFLAVKTGRELNQLKGHVLWSRNRVTRRDATPVAGVYAVIVGHTPVRSPMVLGNTIHIDGGACFGRSLFMLELSDIQSLLNSAT